jgi:hypothetical protein
MAFTDGEPLDAAKLGDLETKVNNLAASIPKIGVSSTNISVTQNGLANASSPTTTAPQIQAANAGEFLLKPGFNTKEIKFPEPFSKTPTVVITTRMNSASKVWHPEVCVSTGATSSTGFSVTCFMPTGTTAHKVYVSYIAISY